MCTSWRLISWSMLLVAAAATGVQCTGGAGAEPTGYTYAPGSTTPSASVAKPVTPPIFEIQPAALDANDQVVVAFASVSPLLNPNMCLDDPGGGTSVGTPMWIWTCNNYLPAQGWTYSGGYLSLQNGALCLDLLSDSISAGVQVVLNACDRSGLHPQQLWTYTGDHLQVTGTDQCLSLPDTTAAASSKLFVTTCDPTDSKQMWGVDNNNAAEIRGAPIVSASNTAKCLDVLPTTAAGQSQVDLRTCALTPGQQWILEGGYLRSGTGCLSVASDNTLVELDDCTGVTTQQWIYVKGALQLAGGSTMCLTLPDGDTDDGVRPQLSFCANLTEQLWVFGG